MKASPKSSSSGLWLEILHRPKPTSGGAVANFARPEASETFEKSETSHRYPADCAAGLCARKRLTRTKSFSGELLVKKDASDLTQGTTHSIGCLGSPPAKEQTCIGNA